MHLTIVLTVYNKEPYLRRALDALLKQEGIHDGYYEVLAVNDGSTDGSAAILDEYAKRDKRVRIHTQTNQGLSKARNNGTEEALGDYVWYVDADDTFSSKSVRLICNAIDERPDVIPIYAETLGVEKIRNQVPVSVEDGQDVLLTRKWEQCGVFWVLRRDFLKDNQLSFLPGVYHEDAEFTPRMLYYAKKVKVIPEVLYTVIHEPNSITGVPRPKRAFDCLTVAEKLDDFVQTNQLHGRDVGKVIDDQAALLINNGFYVIVQNGRGAQRDFNKVFRSKPQLMIILSSSTMRKYKIEAIMFKLLPNCYVQIYKLMKFFMRQK